MAATSRLILTRTSKRPRTLRSGVWFRLGLPSTLFIVCSICYSLVIGRHRPVPVPAGAGLFRIYKPETGPRHTHGIHATLKECREVMAQCKDELLMR